VKAKIKQGVFDGLGYGSSQIAVFLRRHPSRCPEFIADFEGIDGHAHGPGLSHRHGDEIRHIREILGGQTAGSVGPGQERLARRLREADRGGNDKRRARTE